MSEEHDDAVTESHDGETIGEALAAVCAIARDLRAHEITADMHEGDWIDPASVRAILDKAADRIYGAADRVAAAAGRERVRLRALVGRLAQRLQSARLTYGPNLIGGDDLLREAAYELGGQAYAVVDGKPVAVLHGRVLMTTDGKQYQVNRPDAGEVAHG